jgi:hypothetical protein
VAEYRNQAHYNDTAFEWDPANRVFSGGIQETSPGYVPMLMQYRDMVRAGTAKDYEAEQYRNWETQARAIPTRDIGSLTAGWQGESQGQWTDSGWQGPTEGWWGRLDPLSPDAGPIMLGIRDKIDAGTASQQERELYGKTMSMASDWDWRASTPQASDAFNPLGDQLFGALGTLALGATGGLAAAPLLAGGAGLATTLGSLGTLAGVAGTGAGVLGQATDQEWLQRLGMALGAAGGIAGGVGGLANLAGAGIQGLGDAARLASNAGRVVGGVGAIADNDALRQAGGWMGTAGQLGGGVENLMNLVGGEGGSLQGVAGLARPLSRLAGRFMQPGQPEQAAPRPVTAAPQRPLYGAPTARPPVPSQGPAPSGIQALLQAARQAQRGGGPLTDEDWLRRSWRRVDTPTGVLANL